MTTVEQKDNVDFVEKVAPASELESEGLVKSRFDELTVWQALKTFRRSLIFTFIVYTGYIVDGFEVSRGAAKLTIGDNVGQYHCESRIHYAVWGVAARWEARFEYKLG